MKKITIFLFSILFSLSVYAEYNAFKISFISEETENIDGSLLLKASCVFNDTTYWNFNPEYELPKGFSWSLVQITNLYGQTFYPNDSIIIEYTLTYTNQDLPYYPKEIKVSFPGDQSVISAQAKIYFTPYNSIEFWNILDFYSLPRRWYQSNEQTPKTRIFFPKDSIPETDINIDSIKTIIAQGGLPNEDIIYSEIEIDGLAYSILMEPIPEDTLQGGKKENYTGTIISTFQTQIINDLYEPETFPLAGIKVELFDYDPNSVDDKLAEGYTNENGVCTLTYSSSQWMQFEEGDLELYVRYKSKNDEYSIKCLHGLSYYQTQTAPNIVVPQNAGVRYITHTIIEDNDSENDAFRAVHWARNGYKFFEDDNIDLSGILDLKLYINQSSSFYNSAGIFIYLNDDAGDTECTIYHEFGHHTQDRICGMPCSGDGSGGEHSWDEENSIQLAWIEG